MEKSEMCRILRGKKIYDSVAECQKDLNEIADWIEKAVVPVRCEKCEHWRGDAPGSTERVKKCEYANWMCHESGYCHFAEKKKEQKNVCSSFFFGRCWGTKEMDETDCYGDRSKCPFYKFKKDMDERR